MSGTVNWRTVLGWTESQLEELRLTGYYYIRQGKYDIALPFYEALVIVDPDKPYNWQTLGALQLELGETQKARENLERALEMNPKHAPTLLNHTKALIELGDMETGIQMARMLKKHSNRQVSSFATALLLAYT